MSLPRIAIVGRPNVGKSSLMNLLARARVSIVDPTPGVTRDRVSTVVAIDDPLKEAEPRYAEVIDTGGYGVYTTEAGRFDDAGEDLRALTEDIETQIRLALDQADVILFVVDAQAGITALDETIAELIRRSCGRRSDAGGEPPRVICVANKVDAENWEPHALEAAGLGFEGPLMISATTNHLRRGFREALWDVLGELGERVDDESDPELRVALIGRRNAGKSSFVNALAGQERCIVSEIAGTTRDAIDVRFEIDGRAFVAVDTAGVRKRTKFADQIEHFAFMRCKAALARADVALLLIDATQDVTGIDKRLGKLIADSFKPCVIVVSKWDLARGRLNRKGRPVTPEDYQEYIEEELPGLGFCPIVFTSSADGVGLRESVEIAEELYRQASERVSTGELNRVFKEMVEERGPSSRLGTEAKILYVSQVASRPPTIVLVVNKVSLFEGRYERYLLNRVRERLPFEEVPVRLLFRERKRAELGEMKSRGYRKARGGAGPG